MPVHGRHQQVQCPQRCEDAIGIHAWRAYQGPPPGQPQASPPGQHEPVQRQLLLLRVHVLLLVLLLLVVVVRPLLLRDNFSSVLML